MIGKKEIKFINIVLAFLMVIALVSGCSSTTPTSAVTKDYDVVVVGAGAAGLSAAVEAAQSGASVAVLEKMPMVGGSTNLSAGIVYATDSDIMNDAGVEDDVDNLVKYWDERSEGHANEDLLRAVAEKSGDTINWLVNDIGVEFMGPMPMGTSPVPRGHMSSSGGNGIINPLQTYAEEKNVEFFLETPANELITNNKGEVTGVKAVDKDNNEIIFNAKSVILASGGFDRNDELMNEYASEAVGEATYVGMGNTGDGLSMAKNIGADIVGNGSVIGFRAVEGELNLESEICGLMWSPYLMVNKEGERFVNEALDYPIIHEQLIKQTDKRALLVFDATTYNPLLDEAVEKGEAYVADTLEDLADQAGVDKDAFLSTVENYNKMIDSGKDTKFDKDLSQQTKIEKGKFYGVKIIAASIGTMTGIKIDADTHVLDTSGNIIPNLYAAGEVANGEFYYKVYPASGTSIQMSLSFGRIAGANAAADLSK